MVSEKLKDIAFGLVIIGLLILVFVPLASYLIGNFTGLEPLKAGPIWRVVLIGVVAATLVSLAVSWGMPNKKWLVIYSAMLLGAGLWLIYELPKLIPTMFSTVNEATPLVFNMSPTIAGIVSVLLLGTLYWYFKKR